ncbi:DNA repair protein RecO [Corynebacterium sputi]|uniref:DNA repair protein RecO n=1 Tax=Corynebacterium sputi TaxID=489915 RepID=UPI0005506E3C|nr:DNA repair protein RecO [Corynebacterium sputi]
MAESWRDRALVVRRHDLGEADRIIVLFTREHGLVRAVAKGVRRAKSRFGSRLSPFVDVDVQIHPGRNLHAVTGADTIHTWASALVGDYSRYTCACGILETAERLAGEEPQPELWDLTVESLGRVSTEDPELALISMMLRGLDLAGWAPSLFDCAQCGKPGPHRAFHPAAGGAVCVECRPPGAATPPTEVLQLMWWLLHGRWDLVDRGRREADFGPQLSRARALTTVYLQWHIGRKISALEYLDPRWGRSGMMGE